MIKFIDYKKIYASTKYVVDDAIQKCLDGGDYIMRQQLKDFEKQLAGYVGTKYAVGVNSGTDALFLSLKALGIGKGDEVITVSHTFVGTINAIVHTGATPVLIDIDEATYNMDSSLIEKAVTSRTKAIIPVHLNGKICDMKPMMELATKYGFMVVEDSCQSLGATHHGVKAGNFGIGCFSFYPAKILGCFGDGGAVTTNDGELAEKIFLLRDHLMDRVSGEFLGHGYNSRLDNIQAAILYAKFPYLNTFIENRRKIANSYHVLGNHFIVPERSDEDVFQHYVIRVKNRDEFIKHLYCNGVESMVFWRKPLHLHKGLEFNVKLPVTEKICGEIVALPIYPELSIEDVNEVIDVCLGWKNEF